MEGWKDKQKFRTAKRQKVKFGTFLSLCVYVCIWLSQVHWETPTQPPKMLTHHWSSSSLLDVTLLTPLPRVLGLTVRPHLLDLNDWPSIPKSLSSLSTSFILSFGFAGSHRHSSLWGLCAKIDKGVPLDNLTLVKVLKIRSLHCPPIHEHTEIYIHTPPHIYIHMNTHYRATNIGKPMFSLFVNIFWLKKFTVHFTQYSLNFTSFALLSHQKFVKPGALCFICYSFD